MVKSSAAKIKVLLVYPRFSLPTGDPPLGLAYIASSLLATGKAEVKIADATFHPSLSFIISTLKQFDPDVVGIYVDTLMYNDAVLAAKAAQQLGKFVITGGPHATVMSESLITVSDIVVIGEGEQTFAEIIDHLPDQTFDPIPGIWFRRQGTIVKTATRTFFVDLDTLPFPAFELLDMQSYMARWHYLDCIDINMPGTNLIGSRGCPFNCTYCQPSLRMLFGTATRYRSAENIAAEILFLKNRYHIHSFFFHDDTLTADRTRLLSLCEYLLKSNMKIVWGCNTRVDTIDKETLRIMHAAGLRKIHVGAESGNQRILDDIYQKKIKVEQVRHLADIAKEAGVHCLGFFILGAPGETRAEIKNTIKFACSLPIDEATFSILTPLPGSEIRNCIEGDDRFSLSNDFSEYNYYSRRAFDDPTLSNYCLKLEQLSALIQFYAHPNRRDYLLSHFKSFNGMKKLMRKVARSF